MADTQLAIPSDSRSVSRELIETWYAWIEKTARDALEKEQAVFDSDGEREYAVHRRMLEICGGLDTLSDALKQAIAGTIEKRQLYRVAPEAWPALSTMIQDTLPHITSPGYACELATIAGPIARFAEKHSLDIYEDPRKLGYLREAASGIAREIENPQTPQKEKVKIIKEELDFVFHEAATRADVRAHFREYRGEQAEGCRIELEDGREVLFVVGNPATIGAIAHRTNGRLVRWRGGKARLATGPLRDGKGGKLKTITVGAMMQTLRVIDPETGELLEEVEA